MINQYFNNIISIIITLMLNEHNVNSHETDMINCSLNQRFNSYW